MNPMRALKLWQAMLLLVLVILLPALLAQGFFYSRWYHSRLTIARDANLHMARNVAQHFNSYVREIVRQERCIGAALVLFGSPTQEHTNQFLQTNAAPYSSIHSLRWTNPDGVVTAASISESLGIRVDDRSYFQAIKGGQREWAISELLLERGSNAYCFVIACGVRDQNVFRGAILAVVDPGKLQEILNLYRNERETLTLFDSAGALVLSDPAVQPSLVSHTDRDTVLATALADGRETSGEIHTSLDDTLRIAARVPINEIGWVAGISRSKAEALAPVIGSVRLPLLVLLGAAVISTAMALVIGRQIVHDVRLLQAHATTMGLDRMEDEIPTTGIAEFRELADVYRNMALKRRQAEEEIAAVARFPEENPNPVVRVSIEGELLYRNPAAAALPGWACVVGESLPDPLLPLLQQAITSAKATQQDVELGGQFYSVSVLPFSAERYANIYGRNVTKRKRAEEALRKAHDELETQVQERTAELEKTMEALRAEQQRFIDVLDILPAYVVLLTPDYHVPFANRFFRERFGESHGRRCFEYLFNRSEPCEVCDTYTVLKTMAPHTWEWTGPDGRIYDIADFPFTDVDGSSLILEMGIDITERRQAEAELQAYRHHLEELVHERTHQLEAVNARLQTEIAERKKVEDSLRESQADLNWAQAVAHTGSWRLDIRRNELRWSDENHRIFGISKETPLTYEAFLAAVHPEDRAYVDERWRAGLRGEPYNIEHRIVVAGSVKWVCERAELEYDSQGELVGGFGTTQDITALKQAEDALRKERDFSAAVLDTAGALVVVLDKEGRIARFNRACELITGYSATEALGRVFWDFLIPPEELAGVMGTWEGLHGRDFPNEYENHWVTKDGARRLIAWSNTVLVRPPGEIDFIVGTGVDITERKEAEAALYRANERLAILSETAARLLVAEEPRQIVNALCEKVMAFLDCQTFFNYLVDEEAGRLHLNAYAGISQDAAEGIEWLDYGVTVCGCAARDGCRIVVENIADTPDPRTDLIRSFGIQAYVCHPLQSQGKVRGTLSFGTRTRARFTDDELVMMKGVADQVAIALERQRSLEELHEIAANLARSNNDLEQFAYVSSHDLQEPLRTISGYLQLIARRYKGKLDKEADEFIDFAVDGTKRMQQLISDLLAYSRVGTRQQPFSPTNCNEVLEEVVAGLDWSIQKTAAVVTHDPLPTVSVDARQLAQLFQNLLANAIKFRGAEPPRLHITARLVDGSWQFSVSDNGIGIEPQYFDRIFVMFQRLHSREKHAGTGIGLAICKKIAERHGGRIWLESEPGRGTTFFFTIPGGRS